MGTAESFLNLLLIFMIVNGIFFYFARKRIKKIAQRMEEDSVPLKIQVEQAITMVTDNICGCNLPKSEAYILAHDNEKHYFCSWDCRKKFITDKQNPFV